ncbi:MAG: PIN domain-containing protein [Saprospiraceae bacterium]|nr:PIN domain-containing protein [Saprospiraceae bacterium]
MKDKAFVDTNLLVYSISTEKIKAVIVEQLFQQSFNFVISTQVINEFVHTCHRKNLLPASEIRQAVEDFLLFFDLSIIEDTTIMTAFDLKARYGFSWYDSLIVSTALEIGCSKLFSEDLQHGMVIKEKLTIQNPFLS